MGLKKKNRRQPIAYLLKVINLLDIYSETSFAITAESYCISPYSLHETRNSLKCIRCRINSMASMDDRNNAIQSFKPINLLLASAIITHILVENDISQREA